MTPRRTLTVTPSCFRRALTVTPKKMASLQKTSLSSLLLLSLLHLNVSPSAAFLFGEKCYGDLGCFDISGDFAARPAQLLPQNPAWLQTKFLLNTRENSSPYSEDELEYTDKNSVMSSHFDAKLPTKFIVHGFLDHGGDTWMVDMAKEFLHNADVNVIRVDWRIGARAPYAQASANTRVIGAEIALLIQRTCLWTGAKPSEFHVLGHSLGGHIAGYAGERIPRLGRITGLDPAEPYFQGYGPKVILDPTDADFVDVIHSDAASFYDVPGWTPGGLTGDKGLGMGDPVGHVDFYPNNGKQQPGCDKTLVDKIISGSIIGIGGGSIFDGVACSHMRSVYLYTESINSPCPFAGYRCPSYTAFLQGLCLNCGISDSRCATMGHHADKFKDRLKEGETNVKMYLKTGADVPRCRNNYVVEVDLTSGLGRTQKGLLHGDIKGEKSATDDVTLSSDKQTLTPGIPYRYLITSTKNIGPPKTFDFWWEYKWSKLDPGSWPMFRKPQIYIKSVLVKTDSVKEKTFCGNNVPVQPGKLQSTVFFPSKDGSDYCANSD